MLNLKNYGTKKEYVLPVWEQRQQLWTCEQKKETKYHMSIKQRGRKQVPIEKNHTLRIKLFPIWESSRVWITSYKCIFFKYATHLQDES